MSSQEELVLIFGVLHLVAVALGGVIMLMLLMRSDEAPQWRPPNDDDESGGGGNDRTAGRPKRLPPSGGVPLPDAEQSATRLRGPGRLSDAHPQRGRRAAPAPRRSPVRSPTRR